MERVTALFSILLTLFTMVFSGSSANAVQLPNSFASASYAMTEGTSPASNCDVDDDLTCDEEAPRLYETDDSIAFLDVIRRPCRPQAFMGKTDQHSPYLIVVDRTKPPRTA